MKGFVIAMATLIRPSRHHLYANGLLGNGRDNLAQRWCASWAGIQEAKINPAHGGR
jgi:hypothetical protein